MNNKVYNVDAPKRPVNVSVNNDLLAQSKALKINISQLLETQLAKKVAECKRAAWKEENKQAIDDYNKRVSTDGLFGDNKRLF
jgi:antitoxin CcdA